MSLCTHVTKFRLVALGFKKAKRQGKADGSRTVADEYDVNKCEAEERVAMGHNTIPGVSPQHMSCWTPSHGSEGGRYPDTVNHLRDNVVPESHFYQYVTCPTRLTGRL